MEITIKNSRVASTGTSDKGPWELIVVTTQDGTEFTTFDKKAKQGEGAVIAISEPKTKKGKLSFEKVLEVKKECQVASPATSSSEQYKADPAKIASEERRSRMHTIKDLWIAGVIDKDSSEVKKLRAWIMEGDTPKAEAKPIKQRPPDAPTDEDLPFTEEQSQGEMVTGDLKGLPIHNLGDLFSACLHHFKINQSEVLKELGGITKEQISDPMEAWLQIVDAKS